MPNVIANKAYKISFLQTAPGKEIDVALEIRSRCLEAKMENNFAILKGLGCFDLIFIYATTDGYTSVLTKTGPIKGILRTSRFFCFQYEIDGTDSQTFFEQITKAPFASISLIKLKPKTTSPIEESRKILLGRANSVKELRGYGFGTLGWVDLAIIKIGNSLDDLVSDAFWASDDSEPAVLKTYTSLAINQTFLPQDAKIAKDADKLKAFFESKVEFHRELKSSIIPRILVAYDPIASKEVHGFWGERNKDYSLYNIAGKDDIYLQSTGIVLLSKLMTDLLHFRAVLETKIYSTETKLDQKSSKGDCNDGCYDESCMVNSIYFEYAYSKFKHLFTEEPALNLASNINSLNGLWQGLSFDAFIDMYSYPKYLINTAEHMKSSGASPKSIGSFGELGAKLIKNGAELRLYGVHNTIEEDSGQFTKLRGGVQKALVAMEFFPNSIIKRATITPQGYYKWSGFISSGTKEFLSLQSVIMVPYEVLWNPVEWWPIYHEIAHILIENNKELLHPNLPEIEQYTANKELQSYWYHIVNEFAAETIGYEIGFFGDFELYSDLVWKYLRKMVPGNDNIEPYFVYCVRTFFVKIYHRLYITTDIDYKYFDNFDDVYKDLFAHFDDIKKKYFDNTEYEVNFDFKEAYFIASENVAVFRELLPWLKNRLRKTIVEKSYATKIDHKNSENTMAVITAILDGTRWDGPVDCPEGVLYQLLNVKSVSYEQSMSFIMTFWEMHRKELMGAA